MNGNKPDWKDAPEWANYCAMDENGEWYWFASRPDYADDSGVWVHPWGSRVESAGVFSVSWKESLEGRPECLAF